jgi:hypothetical protein
MAGHAASGARDRALTEGTETVTPDQAYADIERAVRGR